LLLPAAGRSSHGNRLAAVLDNVHLVEGFAGNGWTARCVRRDRKGRCIRHAWRKTSGFEHHAAAPLLVAQSRAADNL